MSKVILDVDPGIDDAIAIMTALRSDDIEVIGIATVYGNVIPQVGALNTLEVLKSMHRTDIPVTLGAERPLRKGPLPNRIKEAKKTSHGKWGLGNLHVNYPIISDALKRRTKNKKCRALNYVIHKNLLEFTDTVINNYRDDDITMIATGPLTNIAKAIMYRPEFVRKINQLLIMGGAYSLDNIINGNITNFAEFNFYCDPEAARLVLTSPILKSKIKVVGLGVTQRPNCGLDIEFVNKVRHEISKTRSTSSKLILSLLEFKLIHNTVFYLHDVLAVLLHERPALFSLKRGNMEISLRGKSRGHSELIVDEKGNVQAAISVNGHQFKNFLYKRLILS